MESKALVVENKRLIGILAVITLILMVPLATGAPWTLSDYVIGATLLLGTGLLFELAARLRAHPAYKAAAGIALGAKLLLTWANLAVGIIGNENNPANQLYFGVIAVAFIGASIARFQPGGMANAMFATALTMFLVPFIAMAIWRPPFGPGVVAVVGINTVFSLFFVASGLLFRRTDQAAQPAL